MRINEEQKVILDSLIVERLKDNPINISLVNSFKNAKNPTLQKVITTKYAFDKDKENSIAYYVVKTPENDILLYFSLKCGELFEKLDMDKMILAQETLKRLRIIENNNMYRKKFVEKAEKFIQDHISEIRNIAPSLKELVQKKGMYEKDLKKELNKEVSRVLKTYSAIEIVSSAPMTTPDKNGKSLNYLKKWASAFFGIISFQN